MDNGTVTLKTLTTQEIPLIIKELEIRAHIKMSEREFKRMIAEKNTFKIMSDFALMGIVSITPSTLPEITVWLSDAEPKKKWTEAIQIIILKAFEKPDALKIKWLLSESQKEMIATAANCGFEKEGELKNEGSNRTTMISFGLSRNGNSPENSVHPNIGAEQAVNIQKLEEANSHLKAKLKSAEKLNENLQVSLIESEEKFRIAEKNLLAAEEKIRGLTSALTKATMEAQNRKPADIDIVPADDAQIKAAEKQLGEKEIGSAAPPEEKTPQKEDHAKTIARPKIKAIHLSKKEMAILKIIIKSGSKGILQKEIYGSNYGYYQNDVSKIVRKLASPDIGLVVNKPEGRASRAFPVMEEIGKQFPELLPDQSKEAQIIVRKEPEKITKPANIPQQTGLRTIPTIISRHHTEKAKKLLKEKIEEGIPATELLNDLKLPCDKKTAENLMRFIGTNFAFMEENGGTEFEKFRIKIWPNIANAIKRGNAVIEAIKQNGIKKEGEHGEEWQINLGILCQKMSELGYTDPEKIKKSIKFLKHDPDTKYQIQITHAQNGTLGENDVIRLSGSKPA